MKSSEVWYCSEKSLLVKLSPCVEEKSRDQPGFVLLKQMCRQIDNFGKTTTTNKQQNKTTIDKLYSQTSKQREAWLVNWTFSIYHFKPLDSVLHKMYMHSKCKNNLFVYVSVVIAQSIENSFACSQRAGVAKFILNLHIFFAQALVMFWVLVE